MPLECRVLDVAEAVAGLATGPAVAKTAKMHHSGELPTRAPELGLGGDGAGIRLAVLFGAGIGRQQILIGLVLHRQRARRAVAIDPQPAVFIDDDRAVTDVGQRVAGKFPRVVRPRGHAGEIRHAEVLVDVPIGMYLIDIGGGLSLTPAIVPRPV